MDSMQTAAPDRTTESNQPGSSDIHESKLTDQ